MIAVRAHLFASPCVEGSAFDTNEGGGETGAARLYYTTESFGRPA